jgi:hypothetical protein
MDGLTTRRPHRCWTQIPSAGARDTGCFSRATHEAPGALIERIRARGGVAQAMFEEDLVVPGEADPAERELAGRVLAELTDRFDTPLFLRVDLVHDTSGDPVLMELEAIDPVLYMATCPGAADAFAAAVRAS